MDQEKLRIGTILREYRKRNHLTQEKLSEQCDITPGFLGQVERGETAPSVNTLTKLIHVLNIDANIIFYPDMDENITGDLEFGEINIRFSQLTKDHQKVVLGMMQQLADLQQENRDNENGQTV